MYPLLFPPLLLPYHCTSHPLIFFSQSISPKNQALTTRLRFPLGLFCDLYTHFASQALSTLRQYCILVSPSFEKLLQDQVINPLHPMGISSFLSYLFPSALSIGQLQHCLRLKGLGLAGPLCVELRIQRDLVDPGTLAAFLSIHYCPFLHTCGIYPHNPHNTRLGTALYGGGALGSALSFLSCYRRSASLDLSLWSGLRYSAGSLTSIARNCSLSHRKMGVSTEVWSCHALKYRPESSLRSSVSHCTD